MNATETLRRLKAEGCRFALDAEHKITPTWPEDWSRERRLATRDELVRLGDGFKCAIAADDLVASLLDLGCDGPAWRDLWAEVDAAVGAGNVGRVLSAAAACKRQAEKDRGASPAVAITRSTAASLSREMAKRRSEEARLLAMLLEAGEAGVPNMDLDPDNGTGRRYSARLYDARRKGWVVDTVQEDERAFRFVLRGYLRGSKAEAECQALKGAA